MLKWLMNKDLVFACETFTDQEFFLPGYRVLVGRSRAPNRGGVAFILKNYLYEKIISVDLSNEEQIWLCFDFIPDVLFGGYYIAPTSSPYYAESDNALIQSKCKSTSCTDIILGGDINAKFGDKIKTLVENLPECTYDVARACKTDKNGKQTLDICRDCDLLPINGLSYENKEFTDGYTYREGTRWLSTVDYCMVSVSALSSVESFEIDHSLDVPSDHAPITVVFDCEKLRSRNYETLLNRSQALGSYGVTTPSADTTFRPTQRRQIKSSAIHSDAFRDTLSECALPPIDVSAEEASQKFSEALYKVAESCRKPRNNNDIPPGVTTSEYDRWQAILSCEDDKLLWKAVNWKGEVDFSDKNEEKPSDQEFKEHLEHLLYPENEQPLDMCELLQDHNVSVDILDAPIDPAEVEHVITKQVKPNKGSGPDGISPGLFHLLPAQWLLYLVTILNMAIFSGYPQSWLYAKLNMLYKKGDRLRCDNYRGISVTNSISKIYDYILYNRLSEWWKPDREQAGAQPGRGCTEHLVTLRLLIEFSIKKRKKLFIAFIDFSKAYDRVPRKTLILVLKKLGCGVVMLAALISMYVITHSIMGVAVISAVVGVRQGSPTSCFLFILYVNVLIRNIKVESGPDSFLQWLHLLMLMDDTVIFASSREQLLRKLRTLDEYCVTYSMLMNEDKTKFFVINGVEDDIKPIKLSSITLHPCTSYVYLGNIYTSDGKLSSSLAAHANDKKKQLHKLLTFLRVNQDMPFAVKRKVVEAAFNSSILYGAESWLNSNPRPVEQIYIAAVRALLSVRQTIPAPIILAEAGMLPLPVLIRKKQHAFLQKMVSERSQMDDDPLMFAMNLSKANRSLHDYMMRVKDDFSEELEYGKMCSTMRDSTSTRYTTYITMNPDLTTHPVYRAVPTKDFIPEHLRISFTRVRTSSHRLRVETGRWARLDRHERLCRCGEAVGDEEHTLTACKLTEPLRAEYGRVIVFPDIIVSPADYVDFKYIHEALKICE